MKDRILAIMKQEGMSPSRFAEEIGIQRAAMSHITSGRNNPSLDVITKILERFPAINPDWLLFGKGGIKRGDETVPIYTIPEKGDLFSTVVVESEPDVSKSPKYRADYCHDLLATTSSSPNHPNQAVVELKKAVRIMVFYSDNTYEIFNPEKG